jgi:hypothetical protein
MSNHRQPARTPLRSRAERRRGVHKRKPGRWRSKFSRFINAYGVDRLALGLAIDPSAVYHWIRGTTAPIRTRAAIIQRLARESGVKLTLDEIYQHSRDLPPVTRIEGSHASQAMTPHRIATNGARAPAK